MLLLCLALVQVVPASATESESLEMAIGQRLADSGRRETYEWLKSVAGQHDDNPTYHDWLGRLAIELGEYREAIPPLRALIELEPRHMGGRLDLVIALQLEGRSHEARNELQALNALLKRYPEAELPSQAQRQLGELNKLLMTGTEQQKVHASLAGYASLGVGHDSNANRGSDDDAITVSLPGYPPFQLPLGADSIKQGDGFSEASGHLEYGSRGNGCRFSECRLWMAGAMVREYNSLSEYDQRHLYAGTRKSYGGRYQREYSVMLQGIRSSEIRYAGLDKRVDEQWIAGVEYRQRVPTFKQLIGSGKIEVIEETDSDNPTSTMASLRLNGVLVPIRGPHSFNQVNRRLLWELGGSWHERPDYLSGNTQRLWLSAQYPFALESSWQGSLTALYRWRQDTEPFSSIFFGDEHREDREWALGVNMQYLVSDNWVVTSKAHYEKSESTITLFDTTRLQLSLSLAYSF